MSVPDSSSRPRTRVPRVALVAVPISAVLGLVALGTVHAHHDAAPAPKSTEPSVAHLLSEVKASAKVAFSGNVVAGSTLALPSTGAGTLSAFAAVGLLAGSHTVRVWYGGPQRQRLSFLDGSGEIDYFRMGSDYWRWDPTGRVAIGVAMHPLAVADQPLVQRDQQWSPLPRVVPGLLGWWAANSVDKDTVVTREPGGRVAGRPVYRLRIEPRQPSSLISSVVVSADTRTYTPLAVKIYAKNQKAAALSTAFTRITFGEPDAQNFAFHPPADSVVLPSASAQDTPSPGVRFAAHGSGWQQVLEFQVSDPGTAQSMYSQLYWAAGSTRHIAGAWGRGVLLASPAVSVLVTDDGRILVGDVSTSLLMHYCK